MEDLTEYRNNYEQNIPQSYRKTWRKANEGFLRAAINAQCHQCVGYSNVPIAVNDCRGYSCPLYNVRPYQKRRKRSE